MLINNPDALKSWLIIILEPLCDADSSALARYVLALLKKDKPVKELKKVMIEQLDVFLAEETKPFVEKLFNAIASEEYLTTSTTATTLIQPMLSIPASDVTTITHPTVDHHYQGSTKEIGNIANTTITIPSVIPKEISIAGKELTPPLDDTQTKEHYDKTDENFSPLETTVVSLNTGISTLPVSSTTLISAKSPPGTALSPQSILQATTKSVSPFKATSDKENQPRELRRRRTSLRSRSRSRSRSADRTSRRSRSRDRRINEREKNQRQFRNKSPPASGRGGSHDRRRGTLDRRRGGMSGIDISERSPRFGSGGGGGTIGKNRSNRSNSRSRSPSIDRGRKNSPSLGSGRSPGMTQHSQLDGNNKRQRCRDFDEKGYCVRGETCPWDHGVNPVVFEGINNSALISMSLREYNPDAPDLWTRGSAGGSMSGANIGGGPMTANIGNGGASVVLNTGTGGINPFTSAPRGALGVGGNFQHVGVNMGKANANGLPNAYARTVSGAVFRPTAPPIPFSFNPAAVTPLQRELIPVPVVDANSASGGDISNNQPSKRRYEMEDSVAIAEVTPAKRKLPMNSRLGPRITNIQNNCSLELRKIPRGMNTIAHLNNHFAKFGKIVNIQISYDGDPEAAIVTFSTHAEANVAYRSTEAVLNNRFIKVFWHIQDIGSGGNVAQMGQIKDDISMIGNSGAMNGRKNSQYHVNNMPAVPMPVVDAAKVNLTTVGAANIATGTAAAAVAVTAATTTASVAIGSSTAVTTSTNPTTATTTASSAPIVPATHVPAPSLRLKNNVQRTSQQSAATNAIIRKKQEDQAKAVVQLANGLRKRKQELLQGYLKQMKSAVELVERCEPTDPQRIQTVATINVLHEKIEKLRKEIAAEQEQIQAQIQNQLPPVKKTKEQQKKELLDIELELFAQQQEGNDTTAIQKRLEELQRCLGIGQGSGGGGGGGVSGSAAVGTGGIGGITAGGIGSVGGVSGGAPGGKPHFPSNRSTSHRVRPNLPVGSTSVDRRPKSIVVTGFASEDCDSLLGHFKHFGEVTKHDVDKTIPQLIIAFSTRSNAEQAILRGKVFKGKRVQISWAPVVANVVTPTKLQSDNSNNNNNNNSNSNASNTTHHDVKTSNNTTKTSDLIDTTDTLPELRLEDEEEDEESEDRSWRR